MYVKMDKIDIYNDSAIILNKKMPKSVISWITILLILVMLLIIFFCIPFNIYKSYDSYVSLYNDESYLILSVKENDFPVSKNDKLYIKNDKYDYELININEENIVLKVDLKDELKIDNNKVVVNILSDRKIIFEILIKKIKKGFGL